MVRVSTSTDDPLTLLMMPPPNESPEERAVREQAEADAQARSDAIDAQIEKDRAAMKRRKKAVKVLLLGQSESGKSATLKNFQMQYAPAEWAAERASWRAVIQLNLIRSVLRMLDALVREMQAASGSPHSPADYLSDSDGEAISSSSRPHPHFAFTDKHRLLKLRLGPLRRVQEDLMRRLGPGSAEVTSGGSALAVPWSKDGRPSSAGGGGRGRSASSPRDEERRQSHEFGVSSTNGWKSALEKIKWGSSGSSGSNGDGAAAQGAQRRREIELDETTDVIVGCKEDMKVLWEDPVVREVLAQRRKRIEDSPGFFLDDIDRVACKDYEPNDEDVVRARLRTVGVQTYQFTIEKGRAAGQDWLMYDVGGTRSSRTAWATFFDDMDAIIFLSPLSCFDEKLREQRKVNRLEDSYLLWRAVCENRVLARTQIILFLNKVDRLQAKLARGVQVREYITSYGDRANDAQTAMKYFQTHFRDIMKEVSPHPRPFFAHFTSVVNTSQTAVTLNAVEESILRTHLRGADLL